MPGGAWGGIYENVSREIWLRREDSRWTWWHRCLWWGPVLQEKRTRRGQGESHRAPAFTSWCFVLCRGVSGQPVLLRPWLQAPCCQALPATVSHTVGETGPPSSCCVTAMRRVTNVGVVGANQAKKQTVHKRCFLQGPSPCGLNILLLLKTEIYIFTLESNLKRWTVGTLF